MSANVQYLTPPSVRDAAETALSTLDAQEAISRIWSRDLTLWPDTPGTRETVRDRLGWLDAPGMASAHLTRIAEAAAAVAADGCDHVVLLGMGGSSLAPDVLRAVMGGAATPRLRMLDSVHPAAIRRTFEGIGRAVVVVASKSGSTIEPTMLAAEARRALTAAGVAAWPHRFIAITDPGTVLAREAERDGYRDLWLNPADIGGRYSALSLFGLVPVALAGLPVADVVADGQRMADRCREDRAAANPGATLGAFLASGVASGRPTLSLLLSPRLQRFGLWIEQLVAESTGKHGVGILPVVESHVQAARGGRMVVALELLHEPIDTAVLDALAATRTPVARISLGNPSNIGGEFFRWEFATAICGWLMRLNPFDQPDVQTTKTATEGLLAGYARTRTLPAPAPLTAPAGLTVGRTAAVAPDADAAATLTAGTPAYVALLAYADPDDPQVQAALAAVATRLEARTSAPVVVSAGPRYLHSTGQLHKGGGPGGRFLLVAHQPAEDLAIPGQAYSFGTLQLAQARGDLQALDAAGRQALLLEVTGGPADLDAALTALIP